MIRPELEIFSSNLRPFRCQCPALSEGYVALTLPGPCLRSVRLRAPFAEGCGKNPAMAQQGGGMAPAGIR